MCSKGKKCKAFNPLHTHREERKLCIEVQKRLWCQETDHGDVSGPGVVSVYPPASQWLQQDASHFQSSVSLILNQVTASAVSSWTAYVGVRSCMLINCCRLVNWGSMHTHSVGWFVVLCVPFLFRLGLKHKLWKVCFLQGSAKERSSCDKRGKWIFRSSYIDKTVHTSPMYSENPAMVDWWHILSSRTVVRPSLPFAALEEMIPSGT